ncbi:hypothetical protein BH09CHL1_BH09CHL1_09850 [soil metagenome]
MTEVENTTTTTPATLSRAARGMRLVHWAIAIVELSALGYLWVCALTGRRDRYLKASIGILATEGVGLVLGQGNCPLGPLQRKVGDSTPMFELILPPRAAKAAVPILAGISFAGLGTLLWRSRR